LFFGSNSYQSPKADVGEIRRYLYEPDASLIRSGLMGEFAIENRLSLIDKTIAYLTSDELILSPWLKTFEIEETFKLDPKVISQELQRREIGNIEIKKKRC